MKAIITIILASLVLTGCKLPEEPERIKTDNPNFTVEKLFTVDGITVYRFNDNTHKIYFTNKTGSVQYEYRRRAGKASSTVRVQTICNSDSLK